MEAKRRAELLDVLNRSLATNVDDATREHFRTLNLMTVEVLVPTLDRWQREFETMLNEPQKGCGHPMIFQRIKAFAHQPAVPLVHKDSDGNDVAIDTFMVDPRSIEYECAWCVQLALEVKP